MIPNNPLFQAATPQFNNPMINSELLDTIKADLLLAQNEVEILQVLMRFAEEFSARSAILLYLHSDPNGEPHQVSNGAILGHKVRWFQFSDRRTLTPGLRAALLPGGKPAESPFYIEDIESNTQLNELDRTILLEENIHAIAFLPLRHASLWEGMVLIHWSTPHTVSQSERIIYDGILPTLAQVVAKRRLHFETLNSDQTTLTLLRLAELINAATSYQDIVDSIAQLQPDADAVLLNLFEHLDAEKATYIDTVAVGGVSETIREDLQPRIPKLPVVETFKNDPLWVSEHVEEDPRFDPQTLEIFQQLPTQAILSVPLRTNERLWGIVVFNYAKPRVFSERERRLAMGIGGLVTAAVERIRSQQALARTKEISTFLYQLAERVNTATTYQGILEAVASLMPDCEGVYLNLWQHLDYEKADYLEVAAAAGVSGEAGQSIGQRLAKTDFPFVHTSYTERVVVVENIYTDPRFDDTTRANLEALGTLAYIRTSFIQDGRAIGTLFFKYTHPRQFSEQEPELMLGISDLVIAAVERIRSQQAIAQAKEVSTLLYRLAESVNTATTYQKLLEAVAILMPDCSGIYLDLWQHLDYEKADYLEVVAAASINEDLAQSIGQRFTKEDFPFMNLSYGERLMVVENVYTDSRLDETTRKNYKAIGTLAYMRAAFVQNNRIIGALFFKYNKPRQFTEQECELVSGISELVLAAVKRIRFSQETANALEAQSAALLAEQETREEIGILYEISEAINSATTFPDIIKSFSPIAQQADAINLILWENLDYQKASYFEIVAGINRAGGPTAFVGNRYQEAQFPIAKHMANLRQAVIEDIDDHPLVDDVTRESWKQLNVQALVMISLIQDGRFYGVISFENMTPRKYSERDCRLILAISDLSLSAVIRIQAQIELASAVEAQRSAFLAEQEAREEVALLYQVSKAINQATTMSEVLDATKQLFTEPVNVAIFAWENYDRDQATYLESIVANDPALYSGLRLPRELVHGPASLDGSEVMIINNVYSPEWADHPYSESARMLGIYSTAFTNLKQAQDIQGILSIASYVEHIFTPRDIRLMSAIADLTAAALERFRSQQAEQEARQEREDLFRASQAINAVNSFREILNAVSHIAFDDGDFYLYIFENFDYRSATYIETVATGEDRFMQMGVRIPLDELPFLREHPRPGLRVYEDIPNHPQLDEVTKATMMRHGVISNLRFGLFWHNRILGGFGIDHGKVRIYSDREKRMITALGELISAAVERIRLQRETHAAKERAEQLAERAQQLAALEERTRLARELHDSVSQALYGIGLGAQTAQRFLDNDPALVRESVGYILALAEAGLAEMRALIFELRPESLENEGLVIALAKQGASLQARHGIEVQLDLCDEPTLALASKESIYRVIREALHNVVKHAGASQITLRMSTEANQLRLEVVDNGVGFETDKDFPGHLGLQSMKERVSQLGGMLSIKSAPQQGTALTVILPL